MRLSRDLVAAVVLASFLAALGAWPHLEFSRALGELAFFKGAFDEDSYFIWWARGSVTAHRALSHYALDLLAALGAGNPDAMLPAADLAFPAGAAVGAYFLAAQLTASSQLRLLIALMLVFGQDLFSLGSSATWAANAGLFERFRALFGAWGPVVVPDYGQSYLTVFRTPEPQLSYGLFFVTLGLIVKLAGAPARPAATLIALCLATLLLAQCYLLLSLPVILLELGFLVVLLAAGRGRAALILGAAVALAGLSIALGAGSQADSTGLVFQSRLPVATPAVAVALVALPLFLAWIVVRAAGLPLAWVALGLLAMPVLLADQQLLTGVMISTRDWERNANYPLLITGLALAAGLALPRLPVWRRALRMRLPALAAGLIALVLVHAQARSYGFWTEENALAVAAARALPQPASLAPATLVVLWQPALAPHLRVRTRDRYAMLLDYTVLFERRVPALTPAGSQTAPSPYETALFEHWRRAGTSPQEADQLLSAEAEQKAGFFLGFLFSLPDYWYPATDNRNVRQREILALIPAVIERYRVSLAAPQGELARRDAVYLSLLAPDAVRPVPGLRLLPLGHGEALGRRVYSYRQTAEP